MTLFLSFAKQYQISSQALKDRYIEVSFAPGTDNRYVRERKRHGMTSLGETIYVFGGLGPILTNTQGGAPRTIIMRSLSVLCLFFFHVCDFDLTPCFLSKKTDLCTMFRHRRNEQRIVVVRHGALHLDAPERSKWGHGHAPKPTRISTNDNVWGLACHLWREKPRSRQTV